MQYVSLPRIWNIGLHSIQLTRPELSANIFLLSKRITEFSSDKYGLLKTDKKLCRLKNFFYLLQLDVLSSEKKVTSVSVITRIDYPAQANTPSRSDKRVGDCLNFVVVVYFN